MVAPLAGNKAKDYYDSSYDEADSKATFVVVATTARAPSVVGAGIIAVIREEGFEDDIIK